MNKTMGRIMGTGIATAALVLSASSIAMADTHYAKSKSCAGKKGAHSSTVVSHVENGNGNGHGNRGGNGNGNGAAESNGNGNGAAESNSNGNGNGNGNGHSRRDFVFYGQSSETAGPNGASKESVASYSD